MEIIVVIVIIILFSRFSLKDDNENQFNENNYSNNQTQRENDRTNPTTENDYISYLNQRADQRVDSDIASYYRNNANQNSNQRTNSTTGNDYISYLNKRADQRINSDIASYYRNNANQNSNPRTNSDTTNNYSSNQNQRETQITNSAFVNEPHAETNNANSNCNGVNTASKTYRPTARKQNNSNIIFKNIESPADKQISNKHSSAEIDLKGLHDAFTGAPLDKSLGLHQCQTCKAYYHTASVHILDDENNSKCVACQATTIIKVVVNKKSTGKDYIPSTANSKNNKNGKVVTFKGFVRKLKRISADYSAVFMGDSELVLLWKNSIKRDNEMRYITSIIGKTVIVRGLLEYGEFGYQIIISEKSMILGFS